MYSVSVIIPTIGRDTLVRAVKSVNSQVECNATAVVVLDDPSRETDVRRMLHDLSYSLIVVPRIGAAAARNVGLDHAGGYYIGYLDDDDVWHPEKAIKQITAIIRSEHPSLTVSVVGSNFVQSNGKEGRARPRQYDPRKESFPNFLVSRRNVRFGSVMYNTPALLGPAGLMRAVRWDENLRKHQDWDLLIRLFGRPDVCCAPINENLVTVYQGTKGSISRLVDWELGDSWLSKHDLNVTGRARADFVMLHILLLASRQRSCKGIVRSLALIFPHFPHAGAFIRAAAGIVSNR